MVMARAPWHPYARSNSTRRTNWRSRTTARNRYASPMCVWRNNRAKKLLCLVPGFIRRVFLDRAGKLGGFRAEVFLVDNPVLADDEGHHARGTVVRRIGQQGKASSHVAIHNVTLGAAVSAFSLGGQDPIIVAVE